MFTAIRRGLAVAPLLILPFTVAAGCGGENAETNCSTSACTVTFDRGVDANASILGIKVELVSVKGNNVTMKVAGQQVTVPAGEQEQAEGFNVSVQSITKDKVVVKISQGGGG